MTERMVIGLLVVAVLVAGARALWRTWNGVNQGGGCAGCPGCRAPAATDCGGGSANRTKGMPHRKA
jgi:hypothetical protein